MSAGASYRARQETAAESARLNAGESPGPRPDPGPGERTSRDAGGSGGGTGPRKGGGRNVPLAPRSKGQVPAYHNYQGAILAEFVLAELLVSMTPIAVRKNQPGLSPYVPRDMTKLLALGLVYFLLELTALTGRGGGRFAAGFGLLILLAVGLNEAANVTKVLNLFAGGSKDTATSDSTGSNEQLA